MSKQGSGRLFDAGQIVATPGALAALEQARHTPLEFLRRHLAGDWGELCAEDADCNARALIDGSRLLSAYRLRDGERLWIITEAADPRGRRAATTLLLPSEY